MFNARKVTDELIEWIRKEFKERYSEKAVIGISGGKDSTICAMLACLALGKENVYGVLMPNGEQKDISDSKRVCKLLDIDNEILNIGPAYEALTAMFGLTPNSVYITNTPARLRMTTLYGVAALLGRSLVINTCNLCEDWVGYSTKFGDSAGDISFLARFTVEEVLAIGVECAIRLHILNDITDLIYKAPADGMCGKTDEDNLGFTYKVLGDYIRGYAIPDEVTKFRIDTMHVRNLHKLELMPAFEYKGE